MMKPCAILIIAALGVLALAGPALQADRIEDIWNKQLEIRAQYEQLNRRLLFSAGGNRDFDTFRLKNPNYAVDSFTRSRTADFITDLLKAKPEMLKIWRTCGLSQPGEYMCRNPRCPIHAESQKQRTSAAVAASLDPFAVLGYIGAVFGGLVLFTVLISGGRPLAAWIDRRFPEKESDTADH